MNWINILVSVALIILTLIFVIKMIVEYKKSKSIDEKVLFWGAGAADPLQDFVRSIRYLLGDKLCRQFH